MLLLQTYPFLSGIFQLVVIDNDSKMPSMSVRDEIGWKTALLEQ